ncbi:hypothetical protein [Yinghuangia sp. YIM S10712]|uniref:hypothetical protein n=1 Tax=Yinghuangia sp. YIM S10712 TaxID=3436930 RepID=UPI003F534E0B
MKLDEAGFAVVAGRAAALGVSVPRFLAEAALAGEVPTVTERHAVYGELVAVRRLLAVLGNDVNRIARDLNAGGQCPGGLDAVLAKVRATAERVDVLAEGLARSGGRGR